MENNRGIDYKILKYVKVSSLRYEVILTICTPNSLDQKSFYEVSILNYPLHFCLDFKFMKSKKIKSKSGCLANTCIFYCKSTLPTPKMMSLYIALNGLLIKLSLF